MPSASRSPNCAQFINFLCARNNNNDNSQLQIKYNITYSNVINYYNMKYDVLCMNIRLRLDFKTLMIPGWDILLYKIYVAWSLRIEGVVYCSPLSSVIWGLYARSHLTHDTAL